MGMVEVTTEKALTIDWKTLRELVEVVTQAARKGLSNEDIWANVEVILSPHLKEGIEQGLKDVKEGRTKRFKDAREMLTDLRSPDDE